MVVNREREKIEGNHSFVVLNFKVSYIFEKFEVF